MSFDIEGMISDHWMNLKLNEWFLISEWNLKSNEWFLISEWNLKSNEWFLISEWIWNRMNDFWSLNFLPWWNEGTWRGGGRGGELRPVRARWRGSRGALKQSAGRFLNIAGFFGLTTGSTGTSSSTSTPSPFASAASPSSSQSWVSWRRVSRWLLQYSFSSSFFLSLAKRVNHTSSSSSLLTWRLCIDLFGDDILKLMMMMIITIIVLRGQSHTVYTCESQSGEDNSVPTQGSEWVCNIWSSAVARKKRKRHRFNGIILNNQYFIFGNWLTNFCFMKTPNFLESFHRRCRSRRCYAPIARGAIPGPYRKWKAEVERFRSLFSFLPFLRQMEDFSRLPRFPPLDGCADAILFLDVERSSPLSGIRIFERLCLSCLLIGQNGLAISSSRNCIWLSHKTFFSDLFDF